MEARAASQRGKLVRSTVRKEEKESRANAVTAVFHDLDKVNAFIDRNGWGPDQRIIKMEEQSHQSHTLAASPGLDIVYCKQCGGRSSGSKLRTLAHECAGIPKGNRSALRLLAIGVKPEPGARVPIEFRMRHWASRSNMAPKGSRPKGKTKW